MKHAIVASLLAFFLVGIASAQQSSQYGTASVNHALYLQTTGMLASMAVVEPCTSEGLSDAVKRADAAYENQDIMTLGTEQNGFAVGFARCALRAASADDYDTFACATVQSATAAIDAHHAMGGLEPQDKARAQQIYMIGKWLNSDAHSNNICKSIVKASFTKLRKLHAL